MKEVTHLNYSELESRRFNLKISRGQIEKLDLDAIEKNIREQKADVAILRIPVQAKSEQELLSDLGFPYIHADTLVYYHCKLQTNAAASMKNEISFEVVNEQNKKRLSNLVNLIFDNYSSHYASNPYFDAEQIRAGYLEWAESYVTKLDEGKISWIARDGDQDLAFATCSFDIKENICEGVLYGVHPDFGGRGIYRDLIKFTKNYFSEEKISKMIVSTQIQNFVVQKVWASEGFEMYKAYDTYHICSFLTNPDKLK